MRSMSSWKVLGLGTAAAMAAGVTAIAAIELRQPLGNPDLALSEIWLQHTTQTIAWVSADAGPAVNLLFSTNSGLDFTTITNGVSNLQGPGVTNYFPWVVPQRPSPQVRVRVEDAANPQELFSISPNDFQIAGLRILSPNGAPEFWNKGDLEQVIWEQNSMGFEGILEYSDNKGATWTEILSGDIMANLAAYCTPTNPTLRGLVRIRASSPPPPFAGMVDVSDKPFPVKGIRVVQPQQGSLFTIGATSQVSFVIASTDDQDGNAPIYYAADGVNFDVLHPINFLSDIFMDGGLHVFNWAIPSSLRPAATARLRVEAGRNPRNGQPYFAQSEEFTVRGIAFDNPTPSTTWRPGLHTINWTSAGIAADAIADIRLSHTGGTPGSYTTLVASNLSAVAETQPWEVPVTLGSSTNARLRIQIISSSSPTDVGYSAESAPFLLTGIRVLEPNVASRWDLGSAQTIRWVSEDAGSLVDLYYSADGGATFDPRPIATLVSNPDGINQYLWTADHQRTPSTNAVVRVASRTGPGMNGASAPFILRGMQVTRPLASNIYAVHDPTNLITWTRVAESPGTVALAFIKEGGPPQLIAAGVTGESYNWIIPLTAVSYDVRIRVSDGVHAATSAVFRVVSEPSIHLVSPAPGEFWDVGSQRTIAWSRGGQMPNDFSVYFSLSPFVVTNQISSNLNVTFDSDLNRFAMPWQVPNLLTQAVIIVRHNTQPLISDRSEPFHITGSFRMQNPPGPFDIYALKPNTPIIWETLGSVRFVDLYYSLSLAHEPSSWVKINASPIAVNLVKPYNPGDLDNSWNRHSYSWTPPNARSPHASIRVQEANYAQRFDPAASGPFADSTEFPINYYCTVYWDVFDAVTSQQLDQVTLIDSSGWTQAELSAVSPNEIVHDYPWGAFTTRIRRPGYVAVVTNWHPENLDLAFSDPQVWTQQVAMTRGSEIIYVAPQGGHRWPFASWEDASTGIQDALDAALDGSLVLVTNGTYSGPITIGETHARLTLRSVNGATVTTVDGGYPGRTNTCLFMNRDAVVDGFRFIHGGGRRIEQLILVVPLQPITEGGGVVMTLGHLRNCIVEKCLAFFGGGLSVQRRSMNWPLPSVEPPYVDYLDGPEVQACVVRDNLALLGGGMVVNFGTIRKCRISNNRATPSPQLVITNNFLPNVGGGVAAGFATRIENSVIEGNFAFSSGGGVSGGEVYNCTVVFNQSSNGVGGIDRMERRPWVLVRNCIIAGNEPSNWNPAATGISFSCSWPQPPGEGNITNVPLFTLGGAYQLPADSPCIDAGVALLDITQDFAGIPRPLDGDGNGTASWDMGAFEFIHATADSDDDGLSDSNEVFKVGSNPTRADSDADGMRDGDELTADTDPRDANSSLHITALETNMLGVRIDWQGGTSAWQVLEYKTDLRATHEPWRPVVTLPPPTPPANAIIYAAPTNSALFYRLRAVRP